MPKDCGIEIFSSAASCSHHTTFEFSRHKVPTCRHCRLWSVTSSHPGQLEGFRHKPPQALSSIITCRIFTDTATTTQQTHFQHPNTTNHTLRQHVYHRSWSSRPPVPLDPSLHGSRRKHARNPGRSLCHQLRHVRRSLLHARPLLPHSRLGEGVIRHPPHLPSGPRRALHSLHPHRRHCNRRIPPRPQLQQPRKYTCINYIIVATR
jgi:hypothetical protein